MAEYIRITRRIDWPSLLWKSREAFIWIAALLILAFTDPDCHHYTLCPFSNLGFHYCPGCGLGRSIAYFFRGDFVISFQTHPLGIPAVGLFVFRIVQVIKLNIKNLTIT
jgi:hypothetical protein